MLLDAFLMKQVSSEQGRLAAFPSKGEALGFVGAGFFWTTFFWASLTGWGLPGIGFLATGSVGMEKRHHC